MIRAKSDRTYSESLGITTSTGEEERQKDKMVTDLRELNKQTVKDSYPFTNIQEILHSLQGTTLFSSLDACWTYHTVRIEHSSRACMAFIRPYSLFQYIQMLFGLANAGSVYCRMLDVALKDV